MYSFVHQTPRLKTNYDSSNSRYNPYHSNLDMASSSKDPVVAPRRNRYVRSSTISVTQLLTDSCSSLLQRLTTRVRGPSQANTNLDHQPSTSSSTAPLTHNVESSFLGTTRSRLEDKYSSVLEKLAGKRRDPERTLEPSVSKTIEKRANPLMKSATSAAIPQKMFPTSQPTRDKTPYRTSTTRLTTQHNNFYPEPAYAYLDHYSAYNVRQKSGNVNDLRPRRSAKPMRTGKSETKNHLKLCPVEIPAYTLEEKDKTPTNQNEEYLDPQIVEREARRKEIQSLIMKYSALDEAYNKATNNNAINSVNNNNLSSQGVIKAPQPPPHAVSSNKSAHKYQPISLTTAVSKVRNSGNYDFYNNLFVSFVAMFTNNKDCFCFVLREILQ